MGNGLQLKFHDLRTSVIHPELENKSLNAKTKKKSQADDLIDLLTLIKNGVKTNNKKIVDTLIKDVKKDNLNAENILLNYKLFSQFKETKPDVQSENNQNLETSEAYGATDIFHSNSDSNNYQLSSVGGGSPEDEIDDDSSSSSQSSESSESSESPEKVVNDEPVQEQTNPEQSTGNPLTPTSIGGNNESDSEPLDLSEDSDDNKESDDESNEESDDKDESDKKDAEEDSTTIDLDELSTDVEYSNDKKKVVEPVKETVKRSKKSSKKQQNTKITKSTVEGSRNLHTGLTEDELSDESSLLSLSLSSNNNSNNKSMSKLFNVDKSKTSKK